MRNVRKLLLPVFVMGALTFNAAFAELTVVTVSMQKLFEGYYKSEQANQRLESIQAQAQAEAQQKQAELEAMASQGRTMQEELQNPVLSDESKAQKQAELQELATQIRQKQAEFQQWNQQTSQNLQQQSADVRGTIIDEIAKVVNEMALKDYGADLVLDTSDILGTSVPTVLYASDDLDITDRVMSKLNADAPNK